MKYQKIFFLLLCFYLPISLLGTTLQGTIYNQKNEPLPFANVYVKGTTYGTTANENGKYSLELQNGNYEIIFTYIGYAKETKSVQINNAEILLNVTLQPEDYSLSELVITAGEDPAYAIMRKVIAKRAYYLNQVNEFQCTAYVKGLQKIVSAPDKILGFNLSALGILDSNNSGIIYLSESISEFSFEKPDKVKEKMIASKVSGNSDNFSWNSASDFNSVDFYKNNLAIDFLSDRIIISPLSDNAMFYYRYRLLGSTVEEGQTIHKIEVIPRRKADPVYRGVIYINDSLYNINSLELMLTKEAQIKVFDTVKISQTFVPIENDVWMPISKRFDISFNMMKVEAAGYYLAIYKDYNIHPNFPKNYFTNETLKIDDASNKRDSIFWQLQRPVPLTPIENADYERKDSLEVLKQSKAHLDSLDKKANHFKPIDLVIGYNYRNTYKKFDIRTMPLINFFNFNTVEGYNISFGAVAEKEFEQKKILRITPILRYGFANQLFSAKANISYFYNRKKSGYINIDGGSYMMQYNRAEPISELVNSLYTLLGELNYMKLYLDQYIAATHRFEIVNGLMFWASAKFSKRTPLSNSNVSGWVDKNERDFSLNIPENNAIDGNNLHEHNAFILKAELRYRPAQKYVSRPDMKISIGSKWPEFSVAYLKGMAGVFNSKTNYDYVHFKIEDNLSLKLLGNMEYLFKVGGFINTQYLPFVDFKHFSGNRTLFGRNYFEGFQLLDYYAASTNTLFYEAHVQHHFDGFLFNKIPGFRKLKLQEVVGAHFLYQENFGDWLEISVGIENILRVIRIDFVNSFSRQHPHRFGVRIGIDFGIFN